MKRPVMVTVIGVLSILTGIGQVLFGGALIGLRNDATFLTDANMTTNKVTAFGGALIVVGVITFVFAIGLLKGSRVSRAVVGIMELCGIVGGVYAVSALDSSRKSTGVGTIIGAVIVLFFLFGTSKAKAFFSKS